MVAVNEDAAECDVNSEVRAPVGPSIWSHPPAQRILGSDIHGGFLAGAVEHVRGSSSGLNPKFPRLWFRAAGTRSEAGRDTLLTGAGPTVSFRLVEHTWKRKGTLPLEGSACGVDRSRPSRKTTPPHRDRHGYSKPMRNHARRPPLKA